MCVHACVRAGILVGERQWTGGAPIGEWTGGANIGEWTGGANIGEWRPAG